MWASLVFLVGGIAAVGVDRTAARLLRERVRQPWRRRLRRITDFAKGLHWIAVSAVLYGGLEAWIALAGETPERLHDAHLSLAMLLALVGASALLHSLKFVVGRRRPRDDFEHGLYGVRPFAFDTQYDSFPSGHAMTIVCVAVYLSVAWPALALVWFALAAALGATRALLVAHFASDVLFGAAIGLAAADIALRLTYPGLAPTWF